MPTGYTADIEKGITFKVFALDCARAFGALVEMRDEPRTAEIPEELKPSEYHTKKIEEIKTELADVKSMTEEFASERAKIEYDCAVLREEDYRKKKAQLLTKYREMLHKVKQWNPPTCDHQGLKDFMIQQIEQSISFDCRDYEPEPIVKLSGKDWLYKKKQSLLRDLNYHTKEDGEERAKTADRNEWVRALRESLNQQDRPQSGGFGK